MKNKTVKPNLNYDDHEAEIQSWPEVVAARKLGDVPDVLMTSFMEKASAILARRDRATQEYHRIKDMKQNLTISYVRLIIVGLACLLLLTAFTLANMFGSYNWPVFAVFGVFFLGGILSGFKKLISAQRAPDILEDSFREAYASQHSALAVLKASLEDWPQSSAEVPEAGQVTLH